MTVQGIGGFFFRAKDPEALGKWYQDHLGIPGFWEQKAGPTVFQPFPVASDYFAADRQTMLNLRVEGLDAMVARLEQAGIEVIRKAEWDGDYGRFARIHDPEGNPIELWEP